MPKTIDYYMTPTSPWAYFGHERFAALAAVHGAHVNLKPVDYGRIFPATGGLPLACWVQERDIADPDTLVQIANEQGRKGAELLAASQLSETKALYDRYTEEAIASGVFGAPVYIYRDEPFWGQDRLEFLDRALAKP
jgi:2-hydroxychromene-2-carboxylate isomerase